MNAEKEAAMMKAGTLLPNPGRHTPRKAEYPVRRVFSAQSLASLEYWITRFRAFAGDDDFRLEMQHSTNKKGDLSAALSLFAIFAIRLTTRRRLRAGRPSSALLQGLRR